LRFWLVCRTKRWRAKEYILWDSRVHGSRDDHWCSSWPQTRHLVFRYPPLWTGSRLCSFHCIIHNYLTNITYRVRTKEKYHRRFYQGSSLLGINAALITLILSTNYCRTNLKNVYLWLKCLITHGLDTLKRSITCLKKLIKMGNRMHK
jgi:hypothetical protein